MTEPPSECQRVVWSLPRWTDELQLDRASDRDHDRGQ
jgi:hypothetical protein